MPDEQGQPGIVTLGLTKVENCKLTDSIEFKLKPYRPISAEAERVHGTGDENVKYAYTLQFDNALIAHNKQFDMMVYPDRPHGIRNVQLHSLYKKHKFFLDNL